MSFRNKLYQVIVPLWTVLMCCVITGLLGLSFITVFKLLFYMLGVI